MIHSGDGEKGECRNRFAYVIVVRGLATTASCGSQLKHLQPDSAFSIVVVSSSLAGLPVVIPPGGWIDRKRLKAGVVPERRKIGWACAAAFRRPDFHLHILKLIGARMRSVGLLAGTGQRSIPV